MVGCLNNDNGHECGLIMMVIIYSVKEVVRPQVSAGKNRFVARKDSLGARRDKLNFGG
jgi:hypothetical protein